ncbi:hypothetical protein L3Q82_020102 [Scortum barcoo]|uniref:Uncharacterized protein n=1 Tax=Scortum barcoo TaxID=214431 RepID=A0ACB8VDR1_9TELE|nr:hypothetical protein L3Q82_020102 [Scortum barcoo]
MQTRQEAEFRPVYSVLMLLGVGSAMNQCEETEEGVPPSKTTLCGEHDGQTKAQRPEQQRPDSPEPEPSCVSIKSHRSMGHPLVFKEQLPSETHVHQQRPDSLVPSCVSMKSDGSIVEPYNCSDGHHSAKKKVQKVTRGQSVQKHQTGLDSIFRHLEENIVTFVKNELKNLQKVMSPDYPECLESLSEDEEVVDGEDEEQRKSSREAFLKITLHFLRRMNQEELADCLQRTGNPTLLNQIYTELYITEGGTAEVNDEHEVRQIETASRKADRPETTIRQEDIFKASPGRDEPIRTVMTKGVAGIGKTVLTQKFTLDWAEDKANQDIHFTFPFTFRELNVLKEKKFSLVELVHHFFTETKEAGICRVHLSGCAADKPHQGETASLCSPLDNHTTTAAANQIPPECVDMVTEVRGFTDPQKEEYFRKRFRNEKQASRIISHIKTSQSLHIMCHIPVFCWITATVLEDVLKTREGGELPKTLTEMYIHFLVVQTKMKNIKYDGGAETDPHWSPDSREMIESLGKLAFEQLQKGNLIFYESDLTECGIDIRAASVYSGVFTQIFKEERGLYQDKVFCFVHLSVQEFLAALHVHLTFINSGVNLLSEEQQTSLFPKTSPEPTLFYQSAVNKALQSPNGHLDLFLRFLLGLSLQTNQTGLRGLVKHTGSISQTNQETVEYIKKKISENLSPERIINLFHCLNELNDRSLVEEIQQYLKKDLDVFDLKKYSASEEALLRLLPVVKASNKALLSGCLITEEGCTSLASALKIQPLPSERAGPELQSSRRLRSEAAVCCTGESTQETGHSQAGSWWRAEAETWSEEVWACELTLDTNTAHRKLKLSEDDMNVTLLREDRPYPDHPERFNVWRGPFPASGSVDVRGGGQTASHSPLCSLHHPLQSLLLCRRAAAVPHDDAGGQDALHHTSVEGDMAAASCQLSEDQFLCSICLDVFTDPVTIPCGHNFCKNCITEHWNITVPWRCPMCNKVFTTKPELFTNTFISEMVAQFREEAQQEASSSSSSEQQVSKPGEVPCDVCTGNQTEGPEVLPGVSGLLL